MTPRTPAVEVKDRMRTGIKRAASKRTARPVGTLHVLCVGTQIVVDAFRRVAYSVSAYIEPGVLIQPEDATAVRTLISVAPTMVCCLSVRTLWRAKREMYRGAAVFSPDTSYAAAARCTGGSASEQVTSSIAVLGKAGAWGAMGGGPVALMGRQACQGVRVAVVVEAATEIGRVAQRPVVDEVG